MTVFYRDYFVYLVWFFRKKKSPTHPPEFGGGMCGRSFRGFVAVLLCSQAELRLREKGLCTVGVGEQGFAQIA